MAKGAGQELAGVPRHEADVIGAWLAGEVAPEDLDEALEEAHRWDAWDALAAQANEAEFAMGWVLGGGHAEDARLAWVDGTAQALGYR
jgi:hypothetical protein